MGFVAAQYYPGLHQGSVACHCLINAFPFPCATDKQVLLSISWSDCGILFISSSSHHDRFSCGDLHSYLSHCLFTLFVTIWKFRNLISLLLWALMRLRLPAGVHHGTLTSMQTESHTWIPSLLGPGGEFCPQVAFARELEFAFTLVWGFTRTPNSFPVSSY